MDIVFKKGAVDNLVKKLGIKKTEIYRKEEGAVINKPFLWDPATDSFVANSESNVFKEIVAQQGVRHEDIMAEYTRRTKLLKKLYLGKYFEFSQVQQIISDYYKNPESVLAKFGVI